MIIFLIDLFGAIVCVAILGAMFAFTVATILAACQTVPHGEDS